MSGGVFRGLQAGGALLGRKIVPQFVDRLPLKDAAIRKKLASGDSTMSDGTAITRDCRCWPRENRGYLEGKGFEGMFSLARDVFSLFYP
jgi:hypothetical protein